MGAKEHGTIATLMGYGKLFSRKLPLSDQEQLIESLRQSILAYSKPAQMILFGSAARRDMTTASDLDVVVIVESPLDVKPTQKALSQLSRLLDWPVDCLVIDRSLFERRAALGGVFAIAKDEGEVLSHL